MTTVVLDREKETKNTIRFTEAGGGQMIYLPKSTIRELGDPARIQLTIAAA